MPWTVTDVDKHKKGLSDKGKKQWCRIANSVLKREMAKGVSESEAAASAIRQANGVVNNANAENKAYSFYKHKQILEYEVKLTLHQKKAHLVAPVVMMVEGVHNGSQGPLFHDINELGKFPASWNGIPIVIYHPEEDGEPVSANSPDIVDNEVVGRVYNTEVEGKKLKAEAWFDEEQLNNVSPETLQDINDGKLIEVSLGMFTENELVEGNWNGEKYIGIAHNHRPDHLAILPDQKGACSLDDGAGLGANQKDKDMERTKKPKTLEMIESLTSLGFSVNKMNAAGEQDLQSIIRSVNDALYKLDEHTYHYLEELYKDYLIYMESDSEGSKMYKQDYKIESGIVSFVGAPVEVHRKVEYVVNKELTRTKFSINNKSKEEQKMAEEKVVKKVTDLIANNQGFAETDRAMLEALTEPQLDKLFVKKEEKKPPETNKAEEKKPEIQALSAEDQAALAFGKRQLKERREKMIKGIQDNTEKGTWDEKVLNDMAEDVLERVYKSVVKEEEKALAGNYSLNGNPPANNTNKTVKEGLYPAGLKMEDK